MSLTTCDMYSSMTSTFTNTRQYKKKKEGGRLHYIVKHAMPCMPASRYNAFRIIIMTIDISLAYVNAFKFTEFSSVLGSGWDVALHILENLQFRRQVSMEVSYRELVNLLPTFTFNETQGYDRNSRIRYLYCACAKICARRGAH